MNNSITKVVRNNLDFGGRPRDAGTETLQFDAHRPKKWRAEMRSPDWLLNYVLTLLTEDIVMEHVGYSAGAGRRQPRPLLYTRVAEFGGG